ncbi:hypothetical protein BDN72DRAFT_73608 [Pluteus cervinus]|uniref:Uncharacterized protein n=1 Tax=Pluteus cervinus TaxID=181527 RepID=A0ACD3AQR6_9AGAR|nr:hypothetical protein BDN72DRAFT_73608 [Pluteus cervinus]
MRRKQFVSQVAVGQFLRSVTGGNSSLFDPFFRCRLLAAKYEGKLYIASVEDGEQETIVGAAYWVPADQPESQEVLKAIRPLKDAYNQQVNPKVRKWWVETFRPPVDVIVRSCRNI